MAGHTVALTLNLNDISAFEEAIKSLFQLFKAKTEMTKTYLAYQTQGEPRIGRRRTDLAV